MAASANPWWILGTASALRECSDVECQASFTLGFERASNFTVGGAPRELASL